ncbi:MAG: hypothetical protein K2L85_06415, partial [Paramuribaculum sp.]|nr:hypothetical protein [Paramuribaculum sp.]
IRSAAAGHPAPDTARRPTGFPIMSPPVPKAPEGFPLLSAAVCAPKNPRPSPARPAVRQNGSDARR